METIYDLFKDFGENKVCVSGLNLIYDGTRIDYVVLNDDNSVSLWAGSPDPNARFGEELVMPKREMKKYFEIIVDEF